MIDKLYAHSEFYKKLLDNLNYKEGKFDISNKFLKIPILHKQDIKSIGYNNLMNAGNFKYSMRSTSGSTGEPK